MSPDAAAPAMVEIAALVKRFDRGRVVAVDGVDLTVPRGSVMSTFSEPLVGACRDVAWRASA